MKVRKGGGEEIPLIQGKEQQLRFAGAAMKRYPMPKQGVAAGRSNRTPETRGSGREDQPHIQGAVAAWAQEGLEALVEGQEGRQRGDTPGPR